MAGGARGGAVGGAFGGGGVGGGGVGGGVGGTNGVVGGRSVVSAMVPGGVWSELEAKRALHHALSERLVEATRRGEAGGVILTQGMH